MELIARQALLWQKPTWRGEPVAGNPPRQRHSSGDWILCRQLGELSDPDIGSAAQCSAQINGEVGDVSMIEILARSRFPTTRERRLFLGSKVKTLAGGRNEDSLSVKGRKLG